MRSMWDASTPPHNPPTGFDAAAGYIGGDTPHVWTIDEWQRLGKLAKLPIWVQDNPRDAQQAQAEAFAALSRLYHIGCPPGHAIALDLEMAVHPGYVDAFHKVMRWAGFYVWVYGSRSVVMRNPACDGYWVADYTGVAHTLPGPVRAVQWTDGPTIDKSVVKWWSWRNRLWR
jgi:hypothetical protein